MAHYNDEITILVPTWNRRKFLGLFLMNVKNQDYPHEKLNLIIDDDGPEGEKFINNIKEVEEYLHPIKVKYINNKPRRSIGKKRNDLIKECKTKIFCFMDDDDVYFSTYISHSYTVMKNFDIHAIDCGNRASLIHEATLMMTYKYYRASCKFGDNSAGEGKNIFIGHERSVAITDIMKIMCCVQHGENTIDKLQFAKEENKLNIRLDPECENILKQILFKK